MATAGMAKGTMTSLFRRLVYRHLLRVRPERLTSLAFRKGRVMVEQKEQDIETKNNVIILTMGYRAVPCLQV